jgi:hypothetical protein
VNKIVVALLDVLRVLGTVDEKTSAAQFDSIMSSLYNLVVSRIAENMMFPAGGFTFAYENPISKDEKLVQVIGVRPGENLDQQHHGHFQWEFVRQIAEGARKFFFGH